MITNKNKFPDVDFLPDDQIRPIGDIGGTTLFLLGFEKGERSPVVARESEDKSYFAVPLYELMSHSQEQVNITEELE